MKLCNWCEGRGVTGKLVYGEDGETVEVLGQLLAVAVVVDQPCSVCGGTGHVADPIKPCHTRKGKRG